MASPLFSSLRRLHFEKTANFRLPMKAKPLVRGRTICCLIADGTDAALVTALAAAVKRSGAMFKVLRPGLNPAAGPAER